MAVIPFPVTEDSIAQAKQAQAEERKSTGLKFTTDGKRIPAFGCRQCDFVSTAIREQQAINGLCAHIVARHRPEPLEVA